MKIIINKEEVFRTRTGSLGISPSKNGYTFSYSFDGEQWTNYEEPVPAGESLMVQNSVPSMYCKLVGNTEDLTAII